MPDDVATAIVCPSGAQSARRTPPGSPRAGNGGGAPCPAPHHRDPPSPCPCTIASAALPGDQSGALTPRHGRSLPHGLMMLGSTPRGCSSAIPLPPEAADVTASRALSGDPARPPAAAAPAGTRSPGALTTLPSAASMLTLPSHATAM